MMHLGLSGSSWPDVRVTTCGASRTFGRRCLDARRAAPGRRSPLRCGGPSAGRTALWCSGPGPGRRTRFAPFGRYAQTCCDKSVHVPRFALGPGPCAPRRRRGAAPATRPRLVENHLGVRSALGGQPVARLLRWRGAQAAGPRAQRARELIWSRLVERSERSDRSEFRDRPCGRAPQWSLSAARAAAAERRRLPAQGAVRSNQSKTSTTAMRRQQTSAPT